MPKSIFNDKEENGTCIQNIPEDESWGQTGDI